MHPNFRFLILVLCSAALIFGCSKQAKKERYLKRADQYFAAKDFKKAEIEYMNALRLEPTNYFAGKRLATINFDRGRFDRAVPILLQLRQVKKDDAEVTLKLAQFYMFAADFPKARTEIAPLLDGAPSNDEAIILLSDTAVTPKDIDETEQRLRALEARAASRVSWNLAMASLQMRRTNTVAAEGFLQKALSIDPNSSRAYFALGNSRWHQKDLTGAGKAFQKAAELAPAESPIRLRVADFQLAIGATNEARAAIERVTREAPDHLPGWIYLAKLDFAQSRAVEGSNAVQTALALDPRNLEARLMQAELQRLSGDVEGAMKNLEDLRKTNPRFPQLLYQLALTQIQARNRPKAIGFLEEALKLNPNYAQATLALAELRIQDGEPAPAVTALQALIKKQPQISQAYFLLASAYGAQNRYAEAVSIYQQVEKASPTNAAAPFYSGIAYRMQNKPADARRAFEKALSLAPDDAMITYQLVDLDLAEKRYGDASRRAQSLEKNPSRMAVGKYLEARVFLVQTNLTAAESALEQAIKADANFTSAYGMLAQVYFAANKTPQALQNLEELTKRDPRNFSSVMLMGTLLEQSGEYQKAIEKYQQTLKISPQFAPAMNNLAYLLAEKLGKIDEAYNYARRARELAPQEGAIADTLGWIHVRRKEYSVALPLLQEAATKAPGEADIQFHLGMGYYMNGMEGPARDALTKAVASKQNFSARAEAQERLAVLQLQDPASDPASMARLEERVKREPGDVIALLKLGEAYERKGVTDKAQQAYENARKANPNSALVQLRLAELYAGKSNKSSEALASAREARRLAPNDPAIAGLLGRLTYTSGDHKRAVTLLEEATRADPVAPRTWFDLAQAYFSVGQIDQAGQAAGRASAAGYKSAELESLVFFSTLPEKPDAMLKAENQIRDTLNKRPDDLPALAALGLLEQQRGKYPAARDAYERILKKYPTFVPARKQLAALYSDYLNDHQKALEHGTEARKTLREDAELARTLGKIAYRQNDFKSAVRFLEESTRKKPDDAEALYFLGFSYRQLKQKSESQRALERALALDPNSPLSAEGKKALSALKNI